jgi:hypothetical protein
MFISTSKRVPHSFAPFAKGWDAMPLCLGHPASPNNRSVIIATSRHRHNNPVVTTNPVILRRVFFTRRRTYALAVSANAAVESATPSLPKLEPSRKVRAIPQRADTTISSTLPRMKLHAGSQSGDECDCQNYSRDHPTPAAFDLGQLQFAAGDARALQQSPHPGQPGVPAK